MKCSVRLAILLEITANLYVHRREIRHSKRGQAHRQRRQRRQATERPNRLRRQHGEKTGSVGCVWPQRASSAGRKRAPWRQWGLRSRGARITRVWPLNKNEVVARADQVRSIVIITIGFLTFSPRMRTGPRATAYNPRSKSDLRLPLKAAEDRSSSAAALAAECIQVAGSTHGDRPPPGDQEYEIQQIVGELGSGYEVTAITKIWLPKASVGSKLVRKYCAEQRAANWVRTR
jgi:hypothetical protein